MGAYLRKMPSGEEWWVFERTIDKKRYRESLGLKKGQERLLSERIEEVDATIIARHYGLDYTPSRDKGLLDYIPAFLALKARIKQVKDYRSKLEVIGGILGNVPLPQLGREHIVKLAEELKRGGLKGKRHSTTVNRYMGVLEVLFNVAIQEDLVRKNPVKMFYKKTQERRRRRPPTEDDLRKILECARRIQDNPNPTSNFQRVAYYAILYLCLTGQRVGQVYHTLKSWMVQEGDGVYALHVPIEAQKSEAQPKAQAPEVDIIPLSSASWEILVEVAKLSTDEYVWPLSGNRRSDAHKRTMAKIRKETGLPDFDFHSLRHLAGTMIVATTPLQDAMVILGHRNMSTTMRYAHPTPRIHEAVTNHATRINGILAKTPANK